MKEIELVVDGAILACTLGTSVSQLKVSSQAGVVANAKLMATDMDMDKIPMVSIQLFGVCKKGPYPPPCVPSPMAWEGSYKKASITMHKPYCNRLIYTIHNGRLGHHQVLPGYLKFGKL